MFSDERNVISAEKEKDSLSDNNIKKENLLQFWFFYSSILFKIISILR